MYNQTYKILAKHFAETVNVQLVFEENAQPSTDGKTIVLPLELADNAINFTLGALLHETAHIRYTEINISAKNNLTKEEHETLNCLEDIRIDAKTVEQYPNAVDFQQKLIQDVIKRHAADLAKEPIPQQVLKGLILVGHKIDPATVYNPETVKIINKLSTFADVALSKNTKQTEDLVLPAKELTKLLIGEVLSNPQQQQKQEAGTGQGDSNGESENEKEGESLSDKYKEYQKQEKKAEKDLKDSQDKKKELADKYEKKYEDYKSARRTLRLNESKRQKLNYEKRRQEAEGNSQSAQETQNKIQEKNERITELAQTYSETVKELQDLKKQHCEADRDIGKAYQNRDSAEQELKFIQSKAFGKSGKTKLLGFEAIDPDALKPDEHVEEIDARQTLDELIKEALIIKRDQRLIDEEGTSLNNSKLADVHTDIDQLFINQEVRENKTKIAIIVDCSGSMGSYSENNKEPIVLALKTVKTIADALQKAIRQGAPADFAIYGFANDVATFIPDCESYTYEKLVAQYKANRLGGGTHLSESVTAITEELKQNSPDTTDRCAIIITDAEVDDRDLDELINTADTDGARFVFVAINALLEGNPAAEKLFGDHNIKDIRDGAEVLQRALFSVM
ncbi:MAG: VWA domain-containing protein [Lutibacter sp.]|jgi:hypothetical protein